ncbi:hypothetical protein HDU99_000972, partial [Rhizoclosmatium hyalinum]
MALQQGSHELCIPPIYIHDPYGDAVSPFRVLFDVSMAVNATDTFAVHSGLSVESITLRDCYWSGYWAVKLIVE